MKNKSNLFLLTLLLTSLISINNKKKVDADTYAWCAAFYNDVDGDGDKELQPLKFNGITTYEKRYVYRQYLTYDPVKYGGVLDSTWDEMYEFAENFCSEHGLGDYDDPYIDFEIENADISEEEKQVLRDLVAPFNTQMQSLYAQDYESNVKYDADVKAFKEAHPEITLGKTIDESRTKIDTKMSQLLYWLHIPYDYNPEKSYPVMVLAQGEWSTWVPSTYLNSDGSYKSDYLDPPDAGQMNSFYSQWYNKVKNPGPDREKYDCFFISILNTNEFFRGNDIGGGDSGYIGINGQHNVEGFENLKVLNYEYTGDTSYSAGYKYTYDSSKISPAVQEQLTLQLIDSMSKEYNLDLDRQYVSGFSLGGSLTNDFISQYPNRFAAAIPLCAASIDITEQNCKNLTHTNIWAISGNNDNNCSKYYAKCLSDAVNEARDTYDIGKDCIAQYSLFAGGHTGGHYSNSIKTAVKGTSITDNNQLLDFLFDSSKTSLVNVNKYKLNYVSNVSDLTGNLPSEEIYNDGDTVFVKDNSNFDSPTHKFICWNSKEDGSGLDYYPGITFSIDRDTTLYAKYEEVDTYKINVSSNNGGSITSEYNLVKEGFKVYLDIEPDQYFDINNITTNSIVYYDLLNKPYIIVGNEDINIDVEFYQAIFHIVFKDGETVLKDYYVNLNEMPLYDESLEKQREEYLYKFISWDKEIEIATKDIEYNAIYQEILIEKKEDCVDSYISKEELNKDIDVNDLFSLAFSNNSSIKLNIGDYSISFDQKTIEKLKDNNLLLNFNVDNSTDGNSEKTINISFDGVEVKKCNIDITLPIDFDIKFNEYVNVYYIDEDGNYILMNSSFDNNTIQFNTSHFSKFVVVKEKVSNAKLISYIIFMGVTISLLTIYIIVEIKKRRGYY